MSDDVTIDVHYYVLAVTPSVDLHRSAAALQRALEDGEQVFIINYKTGRSIQVRPEEVMDWAPGMRIRGDLPLEFVGDVEEGNEDGS